MKNFDLETQIAQWRQRMVAAGIKTPVPLDELESHLREEVERLIGAGMDAKTACETAMGEIGAANALKIEFAKAEKEARAAKEARLMLAVSLMTIAGLTVATGAFLFFRIGNFSEITSAQQNSGYAALLLTLLFGFGGRFACKIFPRIARKKIRDAICISAGAALAAWWIVLFWGILPRHAYTMAELMVVIIWSFVMPFGLMVGLCAGIKTAVRKSTATS